MAKCGYIQGIILALKRIGWWQDFILPIKHNYTPSLGGVIKFSGPNCVILKADLTTRKRGKNENHILSNRCRRTFR